MEVIETNILGLLLTAFLGGLIGAGIMARIALHWLRKIEDELKKF